MIEVTIERMGAQGDGIARGAAGPLFAAYTLPREKVRGTVEKDRLLLDAVLAPSPERVAPSCDHFGRCGGCLLQHWDLAPYLAWKHSLVVDALAHEHLETEVRPIIDAHGEGRRRVIFHARQYGARTVVGFAERRSHAMVAIDACPVLDPRLDRALPAARAVAEALAPLKKPLDIQIVATDTGLDMDVRGSGPVPPRLLGKLAEVAARFGLARLTRHGELLLQREPPRLAMGRAHVELPPAAFLQATAEGERVLAREVMAAMEGAKRVADLFAGAGTFALRLAERARVYAAESHQGALAALLKGARTPGLRGVEGEVRDLFRRPLMPAELAAFDAAVIDPPRQGAEAQVRQMAQSKLARLAYVSCNVDSFARDARILAEGGFRLRHVTPVDQFRYSPHVELVAILDR